MKKYFTNNRGFTLMEVTVVMAIVTIGMLGVSSLVVQNIQTENVNKNYLVASMLAQEGIELIRNIRDANWLNPGNSWNDGLVLDGNYSIDQAGIYPGADVITDNEAHLFVNAGGYYNHSAGASTPYYRLIEVDDRTDYLIATSTVEWQERGKKQRYIITTNLYNWR